MINRNLQILGDLLAFELRNAERHGLSEIRITAARARTILSDIRSITEKAPAPKNRREPAYFNHLDKQLA
jgi:hypothetical protein